MRNKNKFKQGKGKIFIIPFIISTLIFIAVCYIAVNGVRNYYYSHMGVDSINLAKSYSQGLSKETEAHDIVNKLLEEKIMVAGRTIASYDEQYSNEVLEELADNLKVDEIYIYNPLGEIVYSNKGELVGRKAREDHPVYNFMNGNSVSFVENITHTIKMPIHYKHGYFKAIDGGFVQIGVKLDKIYNFLDNFGMQQLLNEMQKIGTVTQLSLIDNNFNIIGSTNSQLIGRKITDQEAKKAILEDKEYSFINNDGKESEYIVYVPSYFEGNKIGTLSIRKSLRDSESIIKKVIVIGLITLVVIYGALLYTMISAYRKDKRLIELAYYDALTGLPNKQYLKEFLTEEIEKNKNNKNNKKAILLINCSEFKIINMTFGFEYGDQILKDVGTKIQELTDDDKKLFRFSADGFVLYIKNYNSQKSLISVINRINEIFSNPFKVKDMEQYIDVQIGIVEIDSEGSNFDKILKDASISLTYIKKNDSINYAFFNEVMERKLQREDLIEKELRVAILEEDTKKLYLEFQPQVDLKTNKVVCFEALARMKTESLGFVSPLEFIDVAERKQLINPLGKFILKTACSFISTMKSEGYDDVRIAVNVSGIQLLRNDFIDTIDSIIDEANIKASNLELEITESVFLDNYDIINEKLRILRERNITISLDDFGTGYSSFSRLRELNIDTVKIDKYFISKLLAIGYKELITGDIISMTHKLGLTVVAEGVELQVQKDYLIENHCDIMQGYLFSKSLPQEEAIKLLKMNDEEKWDNIKTRKLNREDKTNEK